jgi:hypothetical protein
LAIALEYLSWPEHLGTWAKFCRLQKRWPEHLGTWVKFSRLQKSCPEHLGTWVKFCRLQKSCPQHLGTWAKFCRLQKRWPSHLATLAKLLLARGRSGSSSPETKRIPGSFLESKIWFRRVKTFALRRGGETGSSVVTPQKYTVSSARENSTKQRNTDVSFQLFPLYLTLFLHLLLTLTFTLTLSSSRTTGKNVGKKWKNIAKTLENQCKT